MTDIKATPHSFLVRIYNDEAQQTRRVMVTRINEAEQSYYFSTLDDLMIFLLQEIEKPSTGELPMI